MNRSIKVIAASAVCTALFLLAALIGHAPLFAADPAPAIPYALDSRPLPSATEADKLLPKEVAGYTRSEIDGELKQDDEVYATYTKGEASVVVSASLSDTAAAAVENVRSSADIVKETYAGKKFRNPGGTKDLTYFSARGDGINFFSWSRGKYYFSADSSRWDAALDEFMKAFPY